MTDRLTRNQSLVFDELSRADGPLSAYAILENLREAGLRAPPQVYRALEKLVDAGRVHRLDSLNAFVACRHPHACEASPCTVFTICDTCGQVEELTSPKLAATMAEVAKGADFKLRHSTVELHGTCGRH